MKEGRGRVSQVGREGVGREGQRRKVEGKVKKKEGRFAVLVHLGGRHLNYLLRL